jgi:predicted dehydrogenase
MQQLGLGVLGLGEGRSIISAGLRSPAYAIVGVCDVNEELGRRRCAEFQIPPEKFTTDYGALLKNPAIDVIGIYTPDPLHAEHIIRALQAGKHVICTKPLMNDLSRGREVLEAVRGSGRRMFVGQSTRFFAPFKRQREHFETGVLGEIDTIEAAYHADHRWFLEKPWALRPDFKWLFGGISHPADLVRWYLPNIVEVMGYASLSAAGRERGLVNPDTFHFVLKASDGRIARVSGSYSNPTAPRQRESDMTCYLRCREGSSLADYPELRYSWKVGRENAIEGFEEQEDHYFRFEGHSHHAGEYQNYIEYFARCLESDATAMPDVTDGLRTIALLQAMEESHTTERPVKIADVLARHELAELAAEAAVDSAVNAFPTR